ncbi:hypothetical protein DRH13_04760 [Candidatus Woesebacteria bacterium]|nr:MAG: hypothetical protein DRH13_04760 [Candidatus Woesebacteria bacterium]
MRRKILYPFTTFILIFLVHAMNSIWKTSQISQQWVQLENISLLSLYFKQQDFFLGFSYALVVAFTTYALLKFLQNSRSGIAGVVGGVTLTGILYVGGCFLLGCCDSPMLAVYLGLFGSSFLGFTKPLIAIITTLSVVIGYFWIEKKSKKCCERNEKSLEQK